MKHIVTIVLTGALMTVAPAANAAPAKTPTGAVHRLFACMQAKPCTDVFAGKALKEWQEVKPAIGKEVSFANLTLAATVSDPRRASKWTRRWAKNAEKLAKAGFNRKELLKLGNGKGIVAIAPGVALAFIAFDITKIRRSKTKREYLLVSVFKQKDGWRIPYIEDSPGKHVEFLLSNKP